MSEWRELKGKIAEHLEICKGVPVECEVYCDDKWMDDDLVAVVAKSSYPFVMFNGNAFKQCRIKQKRSMRDIWLDPKTHWAKDKSQVTKFQVTKYWIVSKNYNRIEFHDGLYDVNGENDLRHYIPLDINEEEITG